MQNYVDEKQNILIDKSTHRYTLECDWEKVRKIQEKIKNTEDSWGRRWRTNFAARILLPGYQVVLSWQKLEHPKLCSQNISEIKKSWLGRLIVTIKISFCGMNTKKKNEIT